ncbi:MAG TPA: hypothetical protein VJH03_17855 [Blastocatellia bacterium]|nr:hypothetical protein [Blastocatellia bacterium]
MRARKSKSPNADGTARRDIQRAKQRPPIPAAGFGLSHVSAASAPATSSILNLQRTIGNQALLRLLNARQPAGESTGLLQLFPAKAGVATEVATSIYTNYLKLDPPFKPQKGTYGKVSWFSGQGNPFIGARAVSADIVVDAEIEGGANKLPNLLTWHLAEAKRKNPKVNYRTDRDGQREVWAAVGKDLEAYEVAEVEVPVNDLNWNEAGTFVAVGPRGRTRVELANPDKLKADLKGKGVKTEALIKAEERKDEGRSGKFLVVFPRISQAAYDRYLHPKDLLESWYKNATVTTIEDKVVAAKEKPTLAEKLRGAASPGHRVMVEVDYETYRLARAIAKSLADFLARHREAAAAYGGIELSYWADSGWKPTAIRGYEAAY